MKRSNRYSLFLLPLLSATYAFCGQIPPLSPRSPPEAHVDRALVRFRGMVQDPSTSAEMYLSRGKGGKLCGWGIEGDDADHDNVEFEHLRECTVVWAISVPGESSWVSVELDASSGMCILVSARSQLKRDLCRHRGQRNVSHASQTSQIPK